MEHKDIIQEFLKCGCRVLHQEKGYIVLDTSSVAQVFLTLENEVGICIVMNDTLEIFEDEIIFGMTKINDLHHITYMEIRLNAEI